MGIRKGFSSQKGSALVLVLLVTIVLFALIGTLVLKANAVIKSSRILESAVSARLISDSVVQRYFFQTLGHTDNWQGEARRYEIVDRSADMADIVLVVRNYNSLLAVLPFRSDEWRSLLKAFGLGERESRQLIDRISDWMDADSFKRLYGYESDDYEFIYSKDHFPFNRWFRLLDELALIPGFPLGLLEFIRDDSVVVGVEDRDFLESKDYVALAYVSESDLVKLRGDVSERGLSKTAVYNRLGLPIWVNSVPSSSVRLEVEVAVDGVRYRRIVDADLLGYGLSPLKVLRWF